MRVRRVDDKGRIATSGNVWLYGKDAVAQTIRTRLRLFYGEYFRNIQDGTPWFQVVFGKNRNQGIIDSVIKSRIVQTNGVIKLLNYSSTEEDDRTLRIEATVLTSFGEVSILTRNA